MVKLIEIENLHHIYHENMANEFSALHEINLTIREGEFVAVIGTNGSGKSTLAKHMNALLLPTSGACRIGGMQTHTGDALWKIRREVGMVFQNPDNQIVATLVEEDIAFGPENLGIGSDEIKQRVKDALQAVGMEKYRSHAPHLLSGGQKQRVAIAGALAMQTKCLVLDEPTAMLDPQGRREVLSTIKELHQKYGITMVYITHFMEEAAAAQRVVVMDKGKIYMEGTPHEIFSRVDELKRLGLDVPLAAQIADKLRQEGISLPQGIITNEELAVALCQLL